MQNSTLRKLPFQLWLALTTAVWLCTLPIRLHKHTLPDLLAQLTSTQERKSRYDPLDLQQTARVITWVCALRSFDLPVFPLFCLRRSLVLYRVLTRRGYSVRIHFGVRKGGELYQGHSWITVNGTPIAERTSLGAYRLTYSYPPLEPKSTTEPDSAAHFGR